MCFIVWSGHRLKLRYSSRKRRLPMPAPVWRMPIYSWRARNPCCTRRPASGPSSMMPPPISDPRRRTAGGAGSLQNGTNQPGIHRDQSAGCGQNQPDEHHDWQRRIPKFGAACFHRQPGSDVRPVPGRIAGADRPAETICGQRRHERGGGQTPPAEQRRVQSGRQNRLHRADCLQHNRHGPATGADRQPDATCGRGRAAGRANPCWMAPS